MWGAWIAHTRTQRPQTARCRSLNETVHRTMPGACGCHVVSVIAAGGEALTLLRSGKLGGSALPTLDTPPLVRVTFAIT